MREVLEHILKINNYIKSEELINDDKNLEYYRLKNKDYYAIYFLDELSENSIDIINTISKDLYKGEKITKEEKSNTTIIVCVKVQKLELSEKEKNIIFAIEENTINFKKYVLWYKEKEVNLLKDEYLEKINDGNYLSNIITNSYDKFEEFFKNPNKSDGYSLILRIFIKFPFLTLNKINPLEKDLDYYMKEELNKISDKLENILDVQDISEDILNSIVLNEKDKRELKKYMSGVEL